MASELVQALLCQLCLLRNTCGCQTADASAAGPMAFELVHDLDPEGVCESIKVCEPVAGAGTAVIAPRYLDAWRSAAQRSGVQALLKDQDNCDTCKLVVLEGAAILRNPVSPTLLCSAYRSWKTATVFLTAAARQMLATYFDCVHSWLAVCSCCFSAPVFPTWDT